VFRKAVVGANNYSPLRTRIDVSGLAAGIYFVQVRREEGVVTKAFREEVGGSAARCVLWRDGGSAASYRRRRNDARCRVCQKGKTDGRQ